MSELRLDVNGTADWDPVLQALSDADSSIPDDVSSAIRKGAETLAQKARDRVRAEPVHGGEQTGLREKIAAGTQVIPTSGGASIQVFPDGEFGTAPLDMDHGAWEHPVFGRRPWVSQGGYFSWFSDTMDEADATVSPLVEQAFDEDIAKIEGA